MSRGYRGLAWIAPMLTRPYRSPGKLYSMELFAEFIYSLVTPRKLAEETPRGRGGEMGNWSRDASNVFQIDIPIAWKLAWIWIYTQHGEIAGHIYFIQYGRDINGASLYESLNRRGEKSGILCKHRKYFKPHTWKNICISFLLFKSKKKFEDAASNIYFSIKWYTLLINEYVSNFEFNFIIIC